MSETKGVKIIISSAIGAGIGTVCVAAIIFAMSLVLAIGNIPAALIMPLATAALAIRAFSAGIASAKINKSKGMACGAVAGILLFLLVWASGGIIGNGDFSTVTAIKAGIVILAGVLGGIVGVNRQ